MQRLAASGNLLISLEANNKGAQHEKQPEERIQNRNKPFNYGPK
jgi:hypothetical protein